MAQRHEERRKAVRRYYRSQAICQMGKDGLGEIVNAQLLNLSASGAQILVRATFNTGDLFFLVILNPRRQVIAEVRAAARWSVEEAPGVFRVGVHFESALSEQQVAEVL